MDKAEKTAIYKFLHKNYPKIHHIHYDNLVQLDIQYLLQQLDDQSVKFVQLPDHIKQIDYEIQNISTYKEITIPNFIARQLTLDFCFEYFTEHKDLKPLLQQYRLFYKIPNSVYQDGKYIFKNVNLVDSIDPEQKLNTRYKVCYAINVIQQSKNEEHPILNTLLKFQECYEDYIYDNEDFKNSIIKAEEYIQETIKVCSLNEKIEFQFLKYFLLPYLNTIESYDMKNILEQINFQHIDPQNRLSSALLINLSNFQDNENVPKLTFQIQQQKAFRQDILDMVKKQLATMSVNYVLFFCVNFTNFQSFLDMLRFFHEQIQNKDNFDHKLEKVIVSTLLKQFQTLSSEFNYNNTTQTAVQDFISFLMKFSQEIQVQYNIFLNPLNSYHTRSNNCQKLDLTQQIDLAQVNFVGTSEKIDKKGLAIISCYSTFTGTVLKLLSDSIVIIKQNWFIQDGRLYRLNIASLAQIFTSIESIYHIMEPHIEDYLPQTVLLDITFPLVSTVIQAEFDHINEIITNKPETKYPIQVNNQQYFISSYVADSISLISTVFSEIIGKFNLSLNSYQLLFSGLLNQIKAIVAKFDLESTINELQASNFEDGKSVQKKWKEKIEFDFDKIQNPGLASIYNSNQAQFDQIKTAKAQEFIKMDQPKIDNEIEVICMQLNSIQKLKQEVNLLFEHVGNEESKVVILLNRENSECEKCDKFDDLKDRIHQTLDTAKLQLEMKFSAFLMQQITFMWHYVYCPEPKVQQITEIVLFVVKIFEQIQNQAISDVKDKIFIQIVSRFARYYFLLLTDSALRARQIAKDDNEILLEDFQMIIKTFGKYVNDETLNGIFQEIVVVLEMHNMSTKQLKIKADGGDSLAFQIVCFRRYIDEDVRKWLIEKKKQNKE